MQGVSFRQPNQTSKGPPLIPLHIPEVLPTGKTEAHKFNMPEDTAGTAELKRRKKNPTS